MTTKMTIDDIMLKYDWEKFCDVMHLNPYLLNEGFAVGSDTITLTEEQLKQLEEL
jgi:hypothetical protein